MTFPRRRLRVLGLAPMPPSRAAAHGGGRAIAELFVRLVELHEITLLCLRGPNDAPVDPLLRDRCAAVHEIAVAPAPNGVARVVRRARVAGAVLGGTPAWVAGGASRPFASLVGAVARAWQPDIVHLEYHLMGAYLPALARCPAPAYFANWSRAR